MASNAILEGVLKTCDGLTGLDPDPPTQTCSRLVGTPDLGPTPCVDPDGAAHAICQQVIACALTSHCEPLAGLDTPCLDPSGLGYAQCQAVVECVLTAGCAGPVLATLYEQLEALQQLVDQACPGLDCSDPLPFVEPATQAIELALAAVPHVPAPAVADPCPADGSIADETCHSAYVGSDDSPDDVDNMRPTHNDSRACPSTSDWYDGWYCQTDNEYLTVYIRPSITRRGDASNILLALTESYNKTVLEVVKVPSPTYSGNAETDIIYYYPTSGYVPDDYNAVTWCENAVNSVRCDQHYVAFDTTAPSRRLACHETGHAVGLTHGSLAAYVGGSRNGDRLQDDDPLLHCLITGTYYYSDYLGPHNTKIVNNTYGK